MFGRLINTFAVRQHGEGKEAVTPPVDCSVAVALLVGDCPLLSYPSFLPQRLGVLPKQIQEVSLIEGGSLLSQFLHDLL